MIDPVLLKLKNLKLKLFLTFSEMCELLQFSKNKIVSNRKQIVKVHA